MALPAQTVISALWGIVCNKTSGGFQVYLYWCQLLFGLCVQIRMRNIERGYCSHWVAVCVCSKDLFVKLVSKLPWSCD